MANLTNYKYWKCRAPFSHSWDDYNLTETGRQPRSLKRNSLFISRLCTQCGTVKWKWIASNGGMTHWYYDYPEGYSIPGEGERVAPVEFRIAYYKRVTMRRG